LEHLDRSKRPVGPVAKEANVGEAGLHAGRSAPSQLLAKPALLRLQARQQRDDRRLDVVENARELGGRGCAVGGVDYGAAALVDSRNLGVALHGGRLLLEAREITIGRSPALLIGP